jgi:hypothetical protein
MFGAWGVLSLALSRGANSPPRQKIITIGAANEAIKKASLTL